MRAFSRRPVRAREPRSCHLGFGDPLIPLLPGCAQNQTTAIMDSSLRSVIVKREITIALTAGSSFGLIYNMNNERSIFVKKLGVRKLNRRNTPVLVRRPTEKNEQHQDNSVASVGVSCRASSTDSTDSRTAGNHRGRTRKLRFLKRCATRLSVRFFGLQALIEGCCDENVACAFIRRRSWPVGRRLLSPARGGLLISTRTMDGHKRHVCFGGARMMDERTAGEKKKAQQQQLESGEERLPPVLFSLSRSVVRSRSRWEGAYRYFLYGLVVF